MHDPKSSSEEGPNNLFSSMAELALMLSCSKVIFLASGHIHAH